MGFNKWISSTSGLDDDIVKERLESELKSYVLRQVVNQSIYIREFVSKNAAVGMMEDSLNELIAEVLLQSDKGIV